MARRCRDLLRQRLGEHAKLVRCALQNDSFMPETARRCREQLRERLGEQGKLDDLLYRLAVSGPKSPGRAGTLACSPLARLLKLGRFCPTEWPFEAQNGPEVPWDSSAGVRKATAHDAALPDEPLPDGVRPVNHALARLLS